MVEVCNPEKDAKHCASQKSKLKIRFKPSLFQHVGKESSLKGKRQVLVVIEFLLYLYNPGLSVIHNTLILYKLFIWNHRATFTEEEAEIWTSIKKIKFVDAKFEFVDVKVTTSILGL